MRKIVFRFVTFICISGVLLMTAGCSETPEDMGQVPAGSNQELLAALAGHTSLFTLGGEDGPQLILSPDLSARVIGASIGGARDENLMWVDKTILDGSYWEQEPLFWNAGGLRTWLAPEDLFFVNAEKDADSWFVPGELDPRPFSVVSTTPIEARFRADIDLEANIGKPYRLTLDRRIALLSSSPVDLPDDVEYMGIEQEHSFTSRMDEVIGVDLPYICLWSLLQLNPSGTILVPLREGYDPQAAYREYFNPLGDRLQISENDIISVKIDGLYRSKIGIRPEAGGRGLAYMRDDGDGSGVLFVKLFEIDPEGVYVDKPWGTDSKYGDAIELYNDDGNMGGFCEIECHGPAKQVARGETQSHLMRLHIFRGPIQSLETIGTELLGSDLGEAIYF